jgi:FkbM family methyltransferase
MRLTSFLNAVGLRPRPRTYPYEVVSFDLPREGRVRYAQWLHPGETRKSVDQATVDELREFLRPGDLAIDIGAHTGDTALPMGLAVGPSGTVLALEPNPYVFPVLEATAQLNPEKARIVPLRFAAAPSDGFLDFEYSDAGFCNGGRHEGISRWRHGHAFKLRVQGVNFRRYLETRHPDLLPRLRFLKVDAEGFDATILESLEKLVAAHKPYVRAEFYRHLDRGQRERLFGFFERNGYRLHRVELESRLRGEPVTLGRLLDWEHFDVLAVPPGAP